MAASAKPSNAADRGIDLDHLALAAEQAFDNFARYYGELGGVIGYGGIDPGFRWSQVRFPTSAPGGGLALELLEPYEIERDDFLRRFLDRNGPGPHHLTFKVADIAATLDAAAAAGYPPVGVDLSNPEWQVGYLHPKSSHGIVIQLAHSGGPPPEPPATDGLTAPKVARPAELVRVVLAVADLAGARRLFTEILGGQTMATGRDDLGDYDDVGWPGGGIVRLVAPSLPAAQAWVGNRLGRVHHVLFAVDEPGLVSGARPLPRRSDRPDCWELAPEANLGTRLRLIRRPAGAPSDTITGS